MSTVDPEPSGVFNIVTRAKVGNRWVTHVYQLPPGTTRKQANNLRNRWRTQDPDSSNGIEVSYSVCESIRVMKP